MRHTTFRRSALDVIAILTIALLVGACGSAGGESSGSLTEVQITLSEFKIESSQTTFTTGTPYRFAIKSAGTIALAWPVLLRDETDESQALVKVEEDELPRGATVTRELTFTEAGDFEFACQVPGHYEAGMLLPISVE